MRKEQINKKKSNEESLKDLRDNKKCSNIQAYNGSSRKPFPGGASGKEPACQCIRHKTREFNPWFKIPWRRAWQHNPVFLPRESQGQRSLVGYSPWDSSSVQFSRSLVSDSLQPHESQHARPPCPSLAPGVHSDSRPSSQ